MKLSDYRNLLERSAEKEKHCQTPYEEFIDFVLQYVKGRCLEIGCGDGIWTGILRRRCNKLVSIDLSEERIKRAKKKVNNLSSIDFILSDARSLPFKDCSFDTICAFEVIEHLPAYEDHLKFLCEVKRVLSKDGIFLISTPNRPLFSIYSSILKEKHTTHFSELNYFQFKSILKANFSFVKIYGRFGWLSPVYKFYIIRKIHRFLSKLTPICKVLLGICRKN